MTETTTSTVIATPYGMFEVKDWRSLSEDTVATVFAVADEKFTINGKTYEGRLTLHRRTYHGSDEVYTSVQGRYPIELTDSAREKLEEAFAPIFDWLPPLTHEERLAKIIEHARISARSKLNHELDNVADRAIRDDKKGGWNGEDPMTPTEVVEVEIAVLEEVRAWLEEKKEVQSLRRIANYDNATGFHG